MDKIKLEFQSNFKELLKLKMYSFSSLTCFNWAERQCVTCKVFSHSKIRFSY